jgi:hypothetical protein
MYPTAGSYRSLTHGRREVVGLHGGVVNAVLGAIPELKPGQSGPHLIEALPHFHLWTVEWRHVSSGLLDPIGQGSLSGPTLTGVSRLRLKPACTTRASGRMRVSAMWNVVARANDRKGVLWLMLYSVVVFFRDHSRCLNTVPLFLITVPPCAYHVDRRPTIHVLPAMHCCLVASG